MICIFIQTKVSIPSSHHTHKTYSQKKNKSCSINVVGTKETYQIGPPPSRSAPPNTSK